jgi:hypothetical protein
MVRHDDGIGSLDGIMDLYLAPPLTFPALASLAFIDIAVSDFPSS